jgi:hypothetical protein
MASKVRALDGLGGAYHMHVYVRSHVLAELNYIYIHTYICTHTLERTPSPRFQPLSGPPFHGGVPPSRSLLPPLPAVHHPARAAQSNTKSFSI